MRRWLHIALLLLAMAAATGCSREAVEPTPGDLLYRRYAQSSDLTVAQVKGFLVADSVKVDVVILVADDSAAWQRLKTELDVRNDWGITSWLGAIEHPERRTRRGHDPVWRVVAVHDDRTVAFYHVGNQAQYQALLEYQTAAMTDDQ